MKTKQEETHEEETHEEEGKETEETDESKEETDEEETDEEKKLGKVLDSKIDKIVQAIKENPVKKSLPYHPEEPDAETSVMEKDPFLRRKRPFVKLSKRMENFIQDVKILAKGGVVKALNEGDPEAGGFTVPEEFNTNVIRYQTEAAIVRPRATVWSMTRDRWRAPKLDQNTTTDTAIKGGEHFAGVNFQYIEEGALKQESQPRFGQVTLVAKKLVGLTSFSDELLEDSAINLANFLVALFGEALAYKEDYEFLRGDGMGRPLGVIPATGTTEINRNTSASILLPDILAMEAALPAWADANAVWLTTKAGRNQLIMIGNTDTTIKLQLLFPSLQAGMPITMLGKPLIVTDKLPALGTRGDIVLGDFSKYYIGDRGAIQVASSIHDRFRYDETVLRIVKRHDGQPSIDGAFVVLNTE